MCWLSHTDVLNFYYLLVFNHSFFRNLKKALETLITWSIMKISEVDNTLILIDIIHGHAISRKEKKTHQTFCRNSPTTDFRATFLYNRRCLASGKTKSRDGNKVAATEQGNFYWERRLCLFWKLYIESITMLLFSLVHQFIWLLLLWFLQEMYY